MSETGNSSQVNGTTHAEDKAAAQDAAAKLNQLATQLKSSFDSEKYPQASEYIDKSMNFMSGLLTRMEQSEDKDKTSSDIADEMAAKATGWLEQKKKELEEKEQKDKLVKDNEKDNEKI